MNQILLNVDDHEVARYARTRILTAAGFTVHEASSGEATLEMAARYKPDLILLDVHLPGIDGFETCRLLKERMHEESCVILQITASAVSPQHATAALDGGADGYITEPIDPDVLIATIRAMLRLHNAERSLAHLNRQLAIANGELVRSNTDLEHFAFAASHDLQEPLRTISIFTELIAVSLEGKLGETEQGYLKQVITSVARMRALIGGLLAYAQVGRESIAKTIVHPREAIDWATTSLKESIDETGTTVAVEEELPGVIGDFTLLCQVFQNLISNAIKYRRPGTPVIVRIDARKTEGAKLQIDLSDNGPGIAREYRDRVFDPFKRLHGPEIPGSGIGLAFCRRIIEAHSGEIWVESEPGSGATFCFTLPLA